MVTEVMRERMSLGLVMGDHPSIAGRSTVLARGSINLQEDKGQARGATKTLRPLRHDLQGAWKDEGPGTRQSEAWPARKLQEG